MQARDNQLTPDGDWDILLYLAGRGWGKSRTGAEDVVYYAMTHPGARIGVVAPTYAAGRDVCIEGTSGILYCLPETERVGWNRSLGELTLKNQSKFNLYTSEKPDALRGPQFDRVWCDELAQFENLEYTFDMLRMCLRRGKHPQMVVTTTPLPLDLVRKLIKDPKTHVVTGSTYDNQENLAKGFIDTVLAKYEGTRLGEQELYAKILDDVPGALWQRDWIESTRIRDEAPEEIAARCSRIVVAIDPATTSTKDSDLTGIVAVGIDEGGHGYVLADVSCKVSPKEWAERAVALLERFKGDRIIGEANNGGDMVESTVRMANDSVPFKKVNASRGKYVRAEPIASLYEQRRISHVGKYEYLENELCMFTPENVLKNSPNRADALVWACTELYGNLLSYGALQALKDAQRSDMTDRAAKVGAASLLKPAVSGKTQKCEHCGAVCIAIVAREYRCSQCGNQWPIPGYKMVAEYVAKRSN